MPYVLKGHSSCSVEATVGSERPSGWSPSEEFFTFPDRIHHTLITSLIAITDFQFFLPEPDCKCLVDTES